MLANADGSITTMPLEDLVQKPTDDAKTSIMARIKTLLTKSEFDKLSEAEKKEAGTLYDHILQQIKWALTSTNNHGEWAGDLWSRVQTKGIWEIS